MLRHIVYQAYGNKEILHECSFSIASLRYQPADDVQVHIFTDQKNYLEKLVPGFVIFHDIDRETIKEWRGKINFVHRVKIKVLQELCKEVRQGPILYLDTDVIAVKDVHLLWQKIAPDNFVMHAREGSILNSSVSIFKKLVPVIEDAVAKGIMKSNDFEMWNAGVLGFMAEQSFLLDEVLQLTDHLYAHKQKHIMEQLSFSYVFRQSGRIAAAEPFFYHYWNLKEFRRILDEVYARPYKKKDLLVNEMLEQKIVQQLVSIKKEYYNHPFNKWRSSLFGKKWKTPSVEKVMRLPGWHDL